MSNGIRCMWMRAGTSKGGFFLAEDLPDDPDAFLLAAMGSPDARQIDGMGGADPLTSKVAIVKKSERSDADVDYLFVQVAVDKAQVSDAQNCGNILAGVGPFAIERGLVAALDGQTRVRIFMENTKKVATAMVQTPNRRVTYAGETEIDGVPGNAAPVAIQFSDIAGSMCGALLPTGNAQDTVDNVEVTLIDNGMPCVILSARDMGISGTETRDELEANMDLRTRLEAIRLKAGPLMGLGDVSRLNVPKMSMVSTAKNGGAISTRTFIPHRCHASIGVLGAISVASACLIPGSVAAKIADVVQGDLKELRIEHPLGASTTVVQANEAGGIESAAVIRTTRKLFDGIIFANQPHCGRPLRG